MQQLILKFVLNNAIKGAGAYFMAHGWATQDQWTAIGGFLLTMAGLAWHWIQSHHDAIATGKVQSPALPPKLAGTVSLLLCCLIPLALVGCALPKDVAHVYAISGDGTSLGVTQNPTTGAYELGLKRVHTHLTLIPIIFQTNLTSGAMSAVIPDVVISDEINARSGIFGGAGGTITVATGTNAVGTLLGGNHVPINAGSGNALPK